VTAGGPVCAASVCVQHEGIHIYVHIHTYTHIYLYIRCGLYTVRE